jgi:hypothetical protein
MLDLRVVLAACLAAFVFLLAGIGLFATLRIGRESSVTVVKEGGLPPEPVRPRVVPRDPRAPVETPANQVRTERPVPPPPPETTGSIEKVLQAPPPAPAAIEDLLKSLLPPPEPPPVVTRVEPVETPAATETLPEGTVLAPPPTKPAAKQIRRAPKAAAKKPRARAARRAQPAATAATLPPFFLFNPQPAAVAH